MTLAEQKLRAPERKKDKLKNLSPDEKIAHKRSYGKQVQNCIRQIQISIQQAMARSIRQIQSSLQMTSDIRQPSSNLYPTRQSSIHQIQPKEQLRPTKSNTHASSNFKVFRQVQSSMHRQTQLATNLTSKTKAADRRIVR